MVTRSSLPKAEPSRLFLSLISRLNPAVATVCCLIPALVCVLAPRQAQAAPPNPLQETFTTLVITDEHGHQISQAALGSTITLTATPKTLSSAPVGFGTVVFCDGSVTACLDGHAVGRAQMVIANPLIPLSASLTLVPTFGAHIYRAVFLGTGPASVQGIELTSTSSPYPFQVVGPPPPFTTTTALASAGTPGNYTLNATVTGMGSGTVKPTGSVNFYDTSNSNFNLGSAALGSTTFSFGFNALAIPPFPPSPNVPFLNLVTAVADVNHDGLPDIIYVVPDFSVANQYDIEVLLNSPAGFNSFPAEEAHYSNAGAPLAMVTGDFNNDGNVDLAISTIDSTVLIFQGSGAGPFGLTAGGPIPTGFIVTSMVVGDFNNSGDQSIVLLTPVGYEYLQGDGDFGFTPGSLQVLTDEDSAMAVGDVNGDGFLDLAIADPVAGTVTMYFGSGTGTFSQGSLPTTVGQSPAAVVLADFNGDGILDLAVANSGDNTVTTYVGDGKGNFTLKSTVKTDATPMFLALGDFNGDGIFDLAAANVDGDTVTVLLGKGDGTFTKSTLTGDAWVGLLAADFNSDGYTDLAAIGQITEDIFLARWTSTSTAKITGVAVAGTGTHLVDANYPGDTNYQGSTSGTVALAAQPLATTLKLVTQPGSISWGQQVMLTATLNPYHAQGITTNTETVTFYDGTTKLGNSQLSLGVATLNVNSLAIGVHNLQAVYAGDFAFAPSKSTVVPFSVGKAASATALSAATNSPQVGVADLLTATVTGFSAPRGNVVFTQDGNLLCSVALGANGKATCSYTPWTTSKVHLVATYEGDPHYAASSSSTLILTATYTVDSSITMTFDSTHLTYPGATNTRTCVTGATHATPTGAFDILDGNTSLKKLPLGGDGCAYWWITPGLQAGTHYIRALYSGDSHNHSGYSAITDVYVSPAPTYMSAACWNSSFSYGQNYNCNVSVWSDAYEPPGTITYSLDGGPSMSATLTDGNTSFVITKPALGHHSVAIAYPGSANYAPTSAPVQHFTVTH